MALSENDRTAVRRVRRSQKVLPVFLLIVWVFGGALLSYRVSLILDITRPLGVESVSELISVGSSIDTEKEQFSRFEVLLLREGDSVTTGLLFMFMLTVFGLSILPMGRLVIRLADSADHSGTNGTDSS
jgi:hypothetical protein